MNYPPLWPCGNYDWEISIDITMGSPHANLIHIPVIIKNGDVTCSK